MDITAILPTVTTATAITVAPVTAVTVTAMAIDQESQGCSADSLRPATIMAPSTELWGLERGEQCVPTSEIMELPTDDGSPASPAEKHEVGGNFARNA